MKGKIGAGIVLVIFVVLGVWQSLPGKATAAPAETPKAGVPIFQVDPYWPKREGNWIFGSIGGIAIDPTNDDVWVLQRPLTLENDENYAAQKPPVSDCCVPGPPVMEFDAAGNFIRGWGGPRAGYDWPEREHGIDFDYKGNVWIG